MFPNTTSGVLALAATFVSFNSESSGLGCLNSILICMRRQVSLSKKRRTPRQANAIRGQIKKALRN